MKFVLSNWSGFEIDSSEYSAMVNISKDGYENIKKFLESPFIEDEITYNNILPNLILAIKLAENENKEELDSLEIKNTSLIDLVDKYKDKTDNEINRENLLEIVEIVNALVQKFNPLIFTFLDSYVVFKFKDRKKIFEDFQKLVDNVAKEEEWYKEVGFNTSGYTTNLFVISVVGIPLTYSLKWYDSQYFDYVLKQVQYPSKSGKDYSSIVVMMLSEQTHWSERRDFLENLDKKYSREEVEDILLILAENSYDRDFDDTIVNKLEEMNSYSGLIRTALNSKVECDRRQYSLRALERVLEGTKEKPEIAIKGLLEIIQDNVNIFIKKISARILKNLNWKPKTDLEKAYFYALNNKWDELKKLPSNGADVLKSIFNTIITIRTDKWGNTFDFDVDYLVKIIKFIAKTNDLVHKNFLYELLSTDYYKIAGFYLDEHLYFDQITIMNPLLERIFLEMLENDEKIACEVGWALIKTDLPSVRKAIFEGKFNRYIDEYYDDNEKFINPFHKHIFFNKNPSEVISEIIENIKEGSIEEQKAACLILKIIKEEYEEIEINSILRLPLAKENNNAGLIEIILGELVRQKNVDLDLKIIESLAKREEYKIKQLLIRILEKIEDEGRIDILLKFLEDEDRKIVSSAIHVLGRTKDKNVVPHIIQILENSELKLEASAIMALGNLNAKSKIDQILPFLTHEDGTTRARAVDALGKMEDKTPLDKILELKDDEYAYVRQNVARVLGRLKKKNTFKILVGYLNDEDINVRNNTRIALGEFGDKRAVKIFTNIKIKLDSDDADYGSIARVLGKLGYREALPYLKKLRKHKHKRVQRAAEEAIEEIKGSDKNE